MSKGAAEGLMMLIQAIILAIVFDMDQPTWETLSLIDALVLFQVAVGSIKILTAKYSEG